MLHSLILSYTPYTSRARRKTIGDSLSQWDTDPHFHDTFYDDASLSYDSLSENFNLFLLFVPLRVPLVIIS